MGRNTKRHSKRHSKKSSTKKHRRTHKRGGAFVEALNRIAVPAALLYGQKVMRKRRSNKKH